MQTQNRFLDEFAKLLTSAAGMAHGAAREAESLWRSRLERLVSDLDLVGREEFDAMKAVALAARVENEALSRRIAALEAALGTGRTRRKTPLNRPKRIRDRIRRARHKGSIKHGMRR